MVTVATNTRVNSTDTVMTASGKFSSAVFVANARGPLETPDVPTVS